MESGGLLIGVLALVIGVVLIFAQVRLFSIDATLKQILAELQKSRPEDSPAPSSGPTQDPEQRRATINKIQQNWPR